MVLLALSATDNDRAGVKQTVDTQLSPLRPARDGNEIALYADDTQLFIKVWVNPLFSLHANNEI